MADQLEAVRARSASNDLMGHELKLVQSRLSFFAFQTFERQVRIRQRNLVRLQPLKAVRVDLAMADGHFYVTVIELLLTAGGVIVFFCRLIFVRERCIIVLLFEINRKNLTF